MKYEVSVSPDGAKYQLPRPEEFKNELDRIGQLVDKARKKTRRLWLLWESVLWVL